MNAEERAEAIADLNLLHENMNALYQAERRIWLTVQGKEGTVDQIVSLRQIEEKMRLLGKQQGEVRRRLYEEENSPAETLSTGEPSPSAYPEDKSRGAEREQIPLSTSDALTSNVLTASASRFGSAVVAVLALLAMAQGFVRWLRRSFRELQLQFRGKKLCNPRPCEQSAGEEERQVQPDVPVLSDGALSVSATSPSTPPVQERVSPPAITPMTRREYEKKRRQCANILAQIQRIDADRNAFFKQMLDQGNAPNEEERAVFKDFRQRRLRLAQAYDALRDELSRAVCGRYEYNTSCGGSRSRAFALTGDLLAADPPCP